MADKRICNCCGGKSLLACGVCSTCPGAQPELKITFDYTVELISGTYECGEWSEGDALSSPCSDYESCCSYWSLQPCPGPAITGAEETMKFLPGCAWLSLSFGLVATKTESGTISALDNGGTGCGVCCEVYSDGTPYPPAVLYKEGCPEGSYSGELKWKFCPVAYWFEGDGKGNQRECHVECCYVVTATNFMIST